MSAVGSVSGVYSLEQIFYKPLLMSIANYYMLSGKHKENYILKIAINFKKDGQSIFRPVFEYKDDGDFKAIHSQAYDQFRKDFPDLSLFDIVVGYEKG